MQVLHNTNQVISQTLARLDKTALILWLLLWLGLYSSGFQGLALDLLERPLGWTYLLRALAPLIAGCGAILVLLRKPEGIRTPTLRGPLGLLLLYSCVGGVSVSLSPQPLPSAYWMASYLSVVLVVWATLGSLHQIILLNWAIAILFTGYFLFVPLAPQLLAVLQTGKAAFWSSFAADFGLFNLGPVGSSGIGRFAAVAFLLSLVRVGTGSKRVRIFWLLVLAVAIMTVTLSVSRTVLVALALALLVLLLLQRQRWLILFAPGLAVAAWLSMFVLTTRGQLNFVAESLEGRLNIWGQGLALMAQSPLLGFGFHADRFLINQPDPNLAYLGGPNMNNAVLQALVQTGIIGAALFVAAFAWSWFLLLRYLTRQVLPEGSARVLTIEALVILAFFTGRGLFESSAAIFGVDLLLLVPALVLVHRVTLDPQGA